jgi:hypothetical protein
VIAVRTDTSGDAGDYRLRLRRSAADDRPPPGFDPVLSGIDFRFKVECPQDFDCLEAEACPPAPAAPEPDTLARDYDGFRRLLTGRLRALLPQWEGASPADLGVTLVEALAYAGDQLSYRLDAVGAEAYLETARHRSSLRRHALLVDYHPSEGTNARTLVQLELAEGEATADIPLAGLAFATAPRPLAGRVPPDPANPRFRALAEQQPVWFEPIDPAGRVEPLESLDPPAVIRIDPRHHQMRLHDWGDGRCRLPAGATAATLRGAFPGLNPGDLLVLEEVIRRADGRIERGDPARRAAVRLLAARVLPPGDPEADPLIGDAVTEIAWHADDALPCALRIAEDVGGGAVFTVARGNMLLADEGRSAREPLPPPPAGWLRLPDRPRGCCAPPDQSGRSNRCATGPASPRARCSPPPCAATPPPTTAPFRPARPPPPCSTPKPARSRACASRKMAAPATGPPGPTCSCPARRTRTSSWSPTPAAALHCASATIPTARARPPAHRWRRITAPAAARPATSARTGCSRPSPPTRGSPPSATRSRPPAARSRKARPPSAAARRAPSCARSAPSPWPIGNAKPAASPACSAPPPSAAGPAAGARR